MFSIHSQKNVSADPGKTLTQPERSTDNAKFAHRGQRLAFGGMPFPHELVSGHTKKNVELLITGSITNSLDLHPLAAKAASLIEKETPTLRSQIQVLQK